MGLAYYLMIRNYNLLSENGSTVWAGIVIVVTFAAGSALLMWLGEQVTEFGIGNGISIILFASIVSRLPSALTTMITNLSTGALSVVAFIGIIISVAIIVVPIVFVSNAERRIPVQYAKRGRQKDVRLVEHPPSHEGNMSGVMPVIFSP